MASTIQQPALPASENKDKLRVLCLHGYRQNGEALKNKLGAFRKFVSQYADFVFITAPHKATPLAEDAETTVSEQRSWWANKDDGSFKGTNLGGPAFGFHESLRLVEEAWQNQGPFQGLLGFSQGACFVGLICGLAKKKMTSIKPAFAILSCGFVSGSLVHKSAYEEPIELPTLHIYGLNDEIIPKEMSQTLAGHFKNAHILTHNGGHYFAATAEQKQAYVRFFQDRLQDYLEKLELQQCGSIFFFEAGSETEEDTEDDESEEDTEDDGN